MSNIQADAESDLPSVTASQFAARRGVSVQTIKRRYGHAAQPAKAPNPLLWRESFVVAAVEADVGPHYVTLEDALAIMEADHASHFARDHGLTAHKTPEGYRYHLGEMIEACIRRGWINEAGVCTWLKFNPWQLYVLWSRATLDGEDVLPEPDLSRRGNWTWTMDDIGSARARTFGRLNEIEGFEAAATAEPQGYAKAVEFRKKRHEKNKAKRRAAAEANKAELERRAAVRVKNARYKRIKELAQEMRLDMSHLSALKDHCRILFNPDNWQAARDDLCAKMDAHREVYRVGMTGAQLRADLERYDASDRTAIEAGPAATQAAKKIATAVEDAYAARVAAARRAFAEPARTDR